MNTHPEHPRDSADAGGEVGDDARLGGAQAGGEGAAAVEAEPAEPEEDGAQDDVADVVGLVRQALGAVSAALSDEDRDGERGGAGGDVHGRSSGEVEAAHDERPALGIPCPARDWVVHDGAPDEDEDDEGTEVRAFSDSTDGEDGTAEQRMGSGRGNEPMLRNSRDGREHALIYTENDGRNAGAAWRWLLEDALKAKVL